jgi:hypothetical protein
VSWPYRKRAEPGMEEENALRFQHAKRSVSCLVNQCPFPFGLEGCGKTISAQQNFDSLHVWNKPGLSGYLVCLGHLVALVSLVSLVHLVHLVCLVQPNKPNKPDRLDRRNRPNEQGRLADCFSILLAWIIHKCHREALSPKPEGRHSFSQPPSRKPRASLLNIGRGSRYS